VTELLEKQQVRFLLAGCCNTALDFLILNVLTLALGLPVLLANSISVMFGISISYALNHFFVFRYPYKISWKKFLSFFALTGFSSLILQNVIIFLFEMFFDSRFGNSLLLLPDAEGRHVLALNIAKLCAVMVGLVWNFLAYRFIVFRKPAPTDPSEGSLTAIANGKAAESPETDYSAAPANE
jgi:putative flippase GtrA